MKPTSWPKEIAITFCRGCSLITFADHVNRADQIPHHFCSQCGQPLRVSLYRHARELRLVGDKVSE